MTDDTSPATPDEQPKKTRIFVVPIDPDEPGSYKQRKRFREITMKLAAARRSTDVVEIMGVMQEAEDFVASRIQTDDGTPVEDALEMLSANEFDALLHAAGGEQNVSPTNASSSPSPSEDTTPTPRDG